VAGIGVWRVFWHLQPTTCFKRPFRDGLALRTGRGLVAAKGVSLHAVSYISMCYPFIPPCAQHDLGIEKRSAIRRANFLLVVEPCYTFVLGRAILPCCPSDFLLRTGVGMGRQRRAAYCFRCFRCYCSYRLYNYIIAKVGSTNSTTLDLCRGEREIRPDEWALEDGMHRGWSFDMSRLAGRASRCAACGTLDMFGRLAGTAWRQRP